MLTKLFICALLIFECYGRWDASTSCMHPTHFFNQEIDNDVYLAFYNHPHAKPYQYKSPSGRYAMVADNGELRLEDVRTGTVIWSNGKKCLPFTTYKFQGDGNFVLYQKGLGAIWHTNTAQSSNILCVKDPSNGNPAMIVMKTNDGRYTRWTSKDGKIL